MPAELPLMPYEIVRSGHLEPTLHYQCSEGQDFYVERTATAVGPVYQDGVSETRKRGKQPEIDDTWREEVEEEMARRGWKNKDLADAVSCEPTIISLVLKRTREKGSVKSSRWAPDISDKLGVLLPVKLRDWRGPVLEKMRSLRRKSPPDFKHEYDYLMIRLDGLLTGVTARSLNSTQANAVEPSHGGPTPSNPDQGTNPPDKATDARRTPRRRR